MIEFKKGDITPNGFEIVEVEYVPRYKMRRRIFIKEDIEIKRNFPYPQEPKIIPEGTEGYLYIDGPYKWVVLDGGNKMFNLKEDDYIWI